MRIKPLNIILLGLLMQFSFAGEIVVNSIAFRATVLPPVTEIPPVYKNYESLFRRGLASLPEGTLLTSALTMGWHELGLDQQQSLTLAPLVSDVYKKIYADPAFSKLPSALSYGFSTVQPEYGHYFMCRPETLPDDPLVIVFLHGFGGNFQFYLWSLHEAFPDAILLTPSWGMSWQNGSLQYLQDMLTDVQRRLKMDVEVPWLMGISAGGRGGFRIYNEAPDAFQGFVCIANAPESKVVGNLRPNLQVLMLNGSEDEMVPVNIARQYAQVVKSKVSNFQYSEIPGSHFFMLSDPEKCFDVIRKFMQMY